MVKVAAFGNWESQITPEYVAGKERSLTALVQADGDEIYFIELRPDEGGRSVLMCRPFDGTVFELLPKNFNVRTRYMEYGGSSFLVHQGRCFFVNFEDQEIYCAKVGEEPRQLTHESGNRFADLTFDVNRDRLLALREVPAHPEARNSICAISLETGSVTDLITGADFYNSARVCGDQLLWTQWNHPNMAWNGTELWTAPMMNLAAKTKIAGSATQAVCQARWGNSGEIFFVAELGEFANLYRYQNGETRNVFPRENEFATPDWVPGMQQQAQASDGTVYATYVTAGRWQILRGKVGGPAQELGSAHPMVSAILPYRDGVIALVSDSAAPQTIQFIHPDGRSEVLHGKLEITIPRAAIAVAEEIRYPTENGGNGFSWFYAPTNPGFTAPAETKPPLVVMAHGGPTAGSSCGFRKEIQFWTSRGYAVADVNYGGSTGYGRSYRERLRGNWGIVDVGDCVAAVKMLAAAGKIDPKRVAIRGGSAGGYTTLAALAFTRDVFAVGASYYGVSELELLAKETHKLESRYLDQLVGPYPQALATYKERAPIEHVENFNCPIIFFQGDEDRVVPPNQSEHMHESLKKRGIATDYHLYKKEGHGFRTAENIRHSLKAEHAFYARFFAFEVQPADRN